MTVTERESWPGTIDRRAPTVLPSAVHTRDSHDLSSMAAPEASASTATNWSPLVSAMLDTGRISIEAAAQVLVSLGGAGTGWGYGGGGGTAVVGAPVGMEPGSLTGGAGMASGLASGLASGSFTGTTSALGAGCGAGRFGRLDGSGRESSSGLVAGFGSVSGAGAGTLPGSPGTFSDGA